MVSNNFTSVKMFECLNFCTFICGKVVPMIKHHAMKTNGGVEV
jgi:hypothetical protein